MEKFLQSPASIYIALLLIILIVLFVIASILKLLLRILFAKIRFSICIFIAFLAISIILGKFALSPIQKNNVDAEQDTTQTLQNASNQFKGIFSNSLPFLAWKFEEIPIPSNLLDGMFTNSTSSNLQKAQIETNLDNKYIKVSYLPFGSVILSYDESTQKFSLVEGLGKGDNADTMDKLLQNINPDLLNSLPKPKKATT